MVQHETAWNGLGMWVYLHAVIKEIKIPGKDG